MTSDKPTDAVKRTCRWCGRKFTATKGEARGRGCSECEPPLVAHADTTKPAAAKV